MKEFRERIQLNSSQRKEVLKYLGTYSVFTEETILKIVRKLKQIEQKLEEKKYG